MNTIATLVERSALAERSGSPATLALGPLNSTSLRDQAYALLKSAIADTDIYDPKQELRLRHDLVADIRRRLSTRP